MREGCIVVYMTLTAAGGRWDLQVFARLLHTEVGWMWRYEGAAMGLKWDEMSRFERE